MARVVSIDPLHPQADVVAEAARILAGGGLVAFPTETVYGLGACAFNERALGRVFEAKGRPTHHPLIAHVAHEEGARRLARLWPPSAAVLADAFWPGPLTLVVSRAPHVPPALSGGIDTIALRVPDHPVAQCLIAALGKPIAAPSANRYQGLSPTAASHVAEQLGDRVDLILDGGPCLAGIESTVVDVRGETACVLRPGAQSLAALRALLPEITVRVEDATDAEARSSPGMATRHYSPRAELVLATQDEGVRRALEFRSQGRRVALVLCRPPPVETPASVIVRVLGADPSLYAHDLFATLHELDAAEVDVVVAERVPDDEAWWAIADRLKRGAAPSR